MAPVVINTISTKLHVSMFGSFSRKKCNKLLHGHLNQYVAVWLTKSALVVLWNMCFATICYNRFLRFPKERWFLFFFSTWRLRCSEYGKRKSTNLYMGVSLNGGTPKTLQNDHFWIFLVGKPWLLGTTILGNPHIVLWIFYAIHFQAMLETWSHLPDLATFEAFIFCGIG